MDRLAHSVLSPRSDNEHHTDRTRGQCPASGPSDLQLRQPAANNNQNNSGNDPTALWGNLAASRSAKPDKKIVDRSSGEPEFMEGAFHCNWSPPTGRIMPIASLRSATTAAPWSRRRSE
jgi:hypothetical protein